MYPPIPSHPTPPIQHTFQAKNHHSPSQQNPKNNPKPKTKPNHNQKMKRGNSYTTQPHKKQKTKKNNSPIYRQNSKNNTTLIYCYVGVLGKVTDNA
jgi:hypothetical protein